MFFKYFLLLFSIQTLCLKIPLDDWSLKGIYGGVQKTFQVKVPSTLFGGILDGGYLSDDPSYGLNLKEYYKKNMTQNPWDYMTNFTLDIKPSSVKSIKLILEGVNYRANIWINDKLVGDANQIVGPYRLFSIEISKFVQFEGLNKIRIQVFPPRDDTFPPDNNSTDLAITFIDWIPEPPDYSTGLWRPVYIKVATYELSTAYPIVQTKLLENGSALLNISFTVCNLESKPYKKNTLAFVSTGPVFLKRLPLLRPKECRLIELINCLHPEPKLWWPWHVEKPVLTDLKIWFNENNHNITMIETKFGIREVYTKLSERGYLQFFINHKYIQIRGAGWTPDLYLRSDEEKIRTQLLLTLDLNLNSIRLEGKMESEYFYKLADELGILLVLGWQCCDAWQHWNYWGPEQLLIAKESMRSQAQRLAIHPSILVFLYSSDQTPPPKIEKAFLDVLFEVKWPNPTISSASASPSNITGPTGVKMSGPYSWVPPNYWLLDDGINMRKLGGAWGFLTEGGPGESPMTIQSWRRTVPKNEIWTERGSLDELWNFHSGNSKGIFRNISRFTTALENRYGKFDSAEAFLYVSQVMAYEGIRSMFESYSRNKHQDATGLIQWMLNNGFPSHIWNLFDYYYVGGGPYYAAKRAGEHFHAMISYTDGSVWVINSLFDNLIEDIFITAEIVDLNGTIMWMQEERINGLREDESRMLNTKVPISGNPWYTQGNKTFFIVLRWRRNSLNTEQTNWYWLTPDQDVLDWNDNTFYNTKVTKFADFSALGSLGSVSLEKKVSFTNSSISVTITHSMLIKEQPSVAFFINVRLLNRTSTYDVAPLMWDDNYFSLLPGESKTINSGLQFNPNEEINNLEVILESWNDLVSMKYNKELIQ